MGLWRRNAFKSLLTRRENWAFIPVVVIIFILLFYSIYSVYLTTPSRPQLSIYSDNWSDLSECRFDIQERGFKVSSIISTPTILSKYKSEEHQNMVYIAVGVERPYSTDDSRAIWDFVHEGGNIIIADDFGHGNSLWENSGGIGIGDIKFDNNRLFDPNYIKNTKFVTVNASINYLRYNLILNEPSALVDRSQYSSGHQAIAMSSEDSWLDKNQNSVRDPAEEKKSYNVIVSISVGESNGRAVIISDPGLFINDNWKMMDNSKFILDLLRIFLPTGGEVIFDESRHINQNTFENSRHLLYSGAVYLTSSIWSIFIIVILVISCTLIVGVKIKPQRKWRNINLLDKEYLNILNYPHVGPNDYWQIYSTILEKVRLGYGFTAEEFKELDRETLFNLIDDTGLWDFISRRFPKLPDNNYHDYYKFIIQRLVAWSPKHPEMKSTPSKKNIRIDKFLQELHDIEPRGK